MAEDGGQDDAQRNNDAMEHDTDGNHGWTLAGALTALGSMLRSLVRERTRTNEANGWPAVGGDSRPNIGAMY